ncbi:kinase-like domain-containing protein [Ampelomyces quisqualis]|uniref:Kinase-like domain-containing protein n=1 Tax=Ampelomyces quisqualis TaxID=50730 RepID=A0A6A5QMW1_AMPQU|nr:kinase-like domain-containing protein [Ampelomyces quisqualis]
MSLHVVKKRDLSHLTQEEIEKHASQGITILYDFGESTIKRYSDNTVVKSGETNRQKSEAAALCLAARLGLPTPRLHEITRSSCDGYDESTIKMDFIEGQTLESVWPTLSVEEKRDICRQLRTILDTMRKAEWPATLIGSCDGGPVLDARLYGIKTGGPFSNEEDLNNFILDIHDMTPQPMRDTLVKHQRKDHRIVFTHGDLHQDNIMVKDGKITGLIDWELAGWYPEYWDYVKFSCSSGAHRDWMDYAKDIFSQTYEEELLFHLALSRFQRG